VPVPVPVPGPASKPARPTTSVLSPSRLLGAAAKAISARPRVRRDPRCRGGGATDEQAGAQPTANTPEHPLVSLELEGALKDARSSLLAIIQSNIPRRCPAGAPAAAAARCPQVWSGVVEATLRDTLERDLGYRLAISSRLRPHDGGLGYAVRFSVAPIMMVRHVRIETTWPVLTEDIARRIHLRAGSPVPYEICERDQALRQEEEGVRDYLNGRGYFDAKVGMRFDELARDEAALEVDIELGARYTVGSVVVDGVTVVAPPEFAKRFRQKTWYSFLFNPAFSRERMKRDARAAEQLLRELGFPGARVRVSYDPKVDVDRRKHTVTLHVAVRERRRIGVNLRGTKQLPAEMLEGAITFDEEGAYDDYEAERSALQIMQEYQRNGFFEAEVRVQRERFPEDAYDTIVFHITEGPRRPLRQIVFRGNQTFPSARLAEIVGSKPTRRTFVVRSQGLLTSQQLRFDLEKLVDFYRSQGFPQTKVSYQVAPATDLMDRVGALSGVLAGSAPPPRGLVLLFTIEEGPRELTGAVRLHGVPPAEAKRLLEVARLAEGAPFTSDTLRAASARLRTDLERRGHPYANVISSQQLNPTTRRIDIDFDLRPGRVVKWGQIIVRGNFKTARDVILRELRIHPGERYDPRAADAAEKRLRAIGLFNAVRLRVLGERERLESVHLLVEVEERYDYSADIELAFGASTDNVAFVSIALIARNLAGWGHEARIGGELGFETQAAEASYTIPRLYLGSTPIGVRAATFVRNEETERLGTLLSFGASLALTKEILPGLIGSARYDIRQVNRSIALVRGAGHDEDLSAVRLATRTGSLQTQLVLDRRNDPLLPTGGYRVSATALYASENLGGTDDFIKLGASGTHFWQPSKRLLLTQSVRSDFGFPLRSAVLPAVERFFAGGDTTVRGYEEDRLFGEVIRSGLSPLGNLEHVEIVPQGGNIRLLHNLDLQATVFHFGIPWAVAVFLDTGIVTNSLRGFSPGKLRHGLGVAFPRLQIPLGFISFEWAIPLDPALGDDPTGRFHLNFGLLF